MCIIIFRTCIFWSALILPSFLSFFFSLFWTAALPTPTVIFKVRRPIYLRNYLSSNSFFRFFIRCAIQLNFLTPKPINLPTPAQRRSVIIGLFGWTIVNLLIHILGTAPEAGEATGGWLHGGLIIDFVGQGMLRMVCTAQHGGFTR